MIQNQIIDTNIKRMCLSVCLQKREYREVHNYRNSSMRINFRIKSEALTDPVNSVISQQT